MSRDDQLQKDILAELNRESRVTAAGMAACRGKGVKAIAEEVEVKLPFENKRSDADTAQWPREICCVVDRGFKQ